MPTRQFSRSGTDARTAPNVADPHVVAKLRLGIDAPITSAEQDLLDRAGFARSVAAAIAAHPLGGVSYAVTGAPGSGKTSVLNLAAAELETSHKVIRFNPWFFSGSGDLTGMFFREVASEMSSSSDKRLQSISEHLRNYSSLLEPLGMLPFVGGFARAGQQAIGLGAATAEYSKRFKETAIYMQRQELHLALSELDVRIVVLVDEVDRLTDPEISEIARLVRLVGHLPRVSYLLAFDRPRVESALSAGRDAAWGNAYLEKIIQWSHDLADPSLDGLGKVLDQALAVNVPTAAARGAEFERWETVRTDVVLAMLRTPRDAVRLGAAVAAALDADGDATDFADVVVTQARRVLAPAE